MHFLSLKVVVKKNLLIQFQLDHSNARATSDKVGENYFFAIFLQKNADFF